MSTPAPDGPMPQFNRAPNTPPPAPATPAYPAQPPYAGPPAGTAAQPPYAAPTTGIAAQPPYPGTPGGGQTPPYAPPAAPFPEQPPVVTKRFQEKKAPSINGLLGMLLLVIVVIIGLIVLIYGGFVAGSSVYGNTVSGGSVTVGILLLIIAMLFRSAFTTVQPGTTKVLQFLGNYVGTIRTTGLRMTYPFTTKRQVSVKVRNFETREIKVNDSQGNPVVIAAIIVWQVRDTAQSVFQVEFYEQFVQVQAEAALRHIATIHPYDNGDQGEATLRGATDQVAAELAREVGARVTIAGVQIVETRISSLSYAPEIASAMLQRQQAQAVLAARAKIVEGAVSMVESALIRIENEKIVAMDEDRKAAMVANLLVVLCSDSRAMPTLNTGM